MIRTLYLYLFWFASTWKGGHDASKNKSFFEEFAWESSLVSSGEKCFCSCSPWLASLTSSTNQEYHLFQHSITPAGQLLMSRQDQGKRESPRPPLKQNGWVSQRFKPLVVELPSVDVKQEKKRNKPKQNINLTFDDLPKIREKASIKKPVIVYIC